MDHVEIAGLKIARPIYDFIAREAISGTGLADAAFWRGFAELVRDLGPRNKALLA